MKKNKQKISNCDSAVKPKKFAKMLFGIGLAGFMGLSTLAGVAFVTPTTAKAESELTQTTTSPFGLNPETDPVIYTTESGLDIKFGGATLESGALSGYAYFTMGSYNGYNINWVIIGRHSSITSTFTASGYRNVSLGTFLALRIDNLKYQVFYNWIDTYYETITPYGKAIDEDLIKNDIIGGFAVSTLNIALSSKEATSDTIDTELNPGEVLVISECILVDTISSGGSNYNGSTLHNGVINLHNSLFLSDPRFISQMISLQTFTSAGTSTTTSTDQYFFLLAGRGEKFNYTTYLPNANTRIAYRLGGDSQQFWWLRSGHPSYSGDHNAILTDGAYVYNCGSTYGSSTGIRPCFVMKLA